MFFDCAPARSPEQLLVAANRLRRSVGLLADTFSVPITFYMTHDQLASLMRQGGMRQDQLEVVLKQAQGTLVVGDETRLI